MKKVLFVLSMSAIIVSFSNCNSERKDPSDPMKKNWYVFKKKLGGICPDPHWGKTIIGASQYDIVCGPLILKEAEKCWADNCNLE